MKRKQGRPQVRVYQEDYEWLAIKAKEDGTPIAYIIHKALMLCQ